jgi:hypothetical protein
VHLSIRDWVGLCFPFATIVLFTVFQILLCLRLDDTVAIAWWVVLSPFLVVEAIHGTMIVDPTPSAYQTSVLEGYSSTFGLGYGGFLVRAYCCTVLRIVFWVLVILQLENVMSISAWLLFLPLFGIAAYSLLGSIADWRLRAGASNESDEDKAITRVASCVAVSVLVVVLVFFITFICLSAAKVDQASFSYGIVFIPAYVLLGLAFCMCFCCCLPLVCCMQRSSGGWDVDREHAEAHASPPGTLLQIKEN